MSLIDPGIDRPFVDLIFRGLKCSVVWMGRGNGDVSECCCGFDLFDFDVRDVSSKYGS